MIAARIACDAAVESVAIVNRWLVEVRVAHQLPGDLMLRVSLVLEELVTNVACYGGVSARIEIAFTADDDGVEITFDDDGIAFDPTASIAPDLNRPITDRGTGGLGVHIVRELMEEVSYRRADGHNRLVLRRAFSRKD